MTTVDASESVSQERRLARTALIAAAVMFAVMLLPLALGRVYTSDDLLNYHLPLRQFYASCLVHGDRFDWMPQLFSGYFVTGAGQGGSYHPLHWLLYRWLPLAPAFTLELVSSYVVMFAGSWMLLRRLLSRDDAAGVGAFSFTFCSFCTLHFLHPNAIAVISHLPWLLLAERSLLRSETDTSALATGRLRGIAAGSLALLTGSQLLLGYPQYVWYSLLAEMIFCLNFSSVSWRGIRQLLGLAALKLTGLALGAVQLLPSIAALSESDRTGMPGAYFHEFPITLADLLQLVHPFLTQRRAFGDNTHELGLYSGAIPLLLAVVALCGCRRRSSSRVASSVSDDEWRLFRFAIVLGTIAVWLALGAPAGLYLLQLKLPLVGSFRWPARIIVLIQLAVAVLAAIGFARVAGRSTTEPRSSMRWITAIPVLSAGCIVFAIVTLPRAKLAPVALLVTGPILFGLATVMLRDALHGRVGRGLVLFLAGDLAVYGFTYEAMMRTEAWDAVLAGIREPPGAPTDGRVVAEVQIDNESVGYGGNELLLKGWHQADGYEGLMPQLKLLGPETTVESLRVAGVRWIVNAGRHDELDGLRPTTDPGWLEVPDPLPRARLMRTVRVVPPGTATSAMVSASGPVIVEAEVLQLPEADDRRLPDVDSVAVISHSRPGHLVIQTRSIEDQLLVISERYSRDWRATVNDRPVDIVRADLDFMGIAVPPGAADVELRFESVSVARGRWISTATLIVVLVLTALSQIRLRSANARRARQACRLAIAREHAVTHAAD